MKVKNGEVVMCEAEKVRGCFIQSHKVERGIAYLLMNANGKRENLRTIII